MTLRSQRSKRYAELSDAEVVQAVLDVQQDKRLVLNRMDSVGWDTLGEAQVEEYSKQLLWLDDELCARDLDWPV